MANYIQLGIFCTLVFCVLVLGKPSASPDLGLPDAEKLKIKTGLVIEIRKAMRNSA